MQFSHKWFSIENFSKFYEKERYLYPFFLYIMKYLNFNLYHLILQS